MRRRAFPLLALLAALAPASAARADFYAGGAIDGPDAAVQNVGGVDIARDGSGTLVYTKQLGADTHVYASRFVNGTFQGPEQIDQGLSGVSSQPAVAVADSGQAAVVFLNGGVLYGVSRPADAQAWPAPTPIFASGDAARPVTTPSIDMSINGVAYVVFTVGSGGNADVAAARLRDNAWSAIPGALDVDPNQSAGTGLSRPRVAVSADNNAVAIWGENGADGNNHVYARRLTVLTPSLAPQELNLPDLEGRPGKSADSPDIDILDDNSYAWAVFRQQFVDGGVTRSRVIARELIGSLFDPPAPIDNISWPATESPENPYIDNSGHGEGLAAYDYGTGGGVGAAFIFNGKFQAPARLDANGSASDPLPVTALGEVDDGVVAWQRDPGLGQPREIHARFYDGQTPIGANPGPPATFGPETNIARPEFGSTDAASGLSAAADRSGNTVIAWVQGTGADKRIVAGLYDKPPSRPFGLTTTNWRNRSKPTLTWNASGDWGTVNYTVTIDGQVAGTATDNSFTVKNKLTGGLHHWAVVGTDTRGQQAAGKGRELRIDTTPPTARIAVHRRKGGIVSVRVLSAHDTGGSGTGRVRIDFGDGTVVERRAAVHRTKKTVRVSVRDKAGNVLVRRFVPGKGKKK